MSSSDQRSAKLKEDNFWHTVFKLSQGAYCKKYLLPFPIVELLFFEKTNLSEHIFPLLHKLYIKVKASYLNTHTVHPEGLLNLPVEGLF